MSVGPMWIVARLSQKAIPPGSPFELDGVVRAGDLLVEELEDLATRALTPDDLFGEAGLTKIALASPGAAPCTTVSDRSGRVFNRRL